jgi:O-antigen/teichoic acid export membrane protein
LLQRFSHDTQELLNGTFVALLMKGLSIVSILVFNIVLARTLSPEETGLYFLAFTVVLLACLVSRLGFEQIIVQRMATDVTVADWTSMRGVFLGSLRLSVILSFCVTLVLVASAPALSTYVFHKPGLIAPLQGLALSILPLTVMVLHAHVMQGMKRIALYCLLQWQGVGISSLSCLGILALGDRKSLLDVVWVLDGAAIVMMVISIYLCARTFPELKLFSRMPDHQQPWPNLLERSLPLLWVNVLNYVVGASSSAVLLGIWWSTTDIGVYSLAARTVQLTSIVLVAANGIAAPKFAALYRSNNLERLAQVARRINLLSLGSALPLIALFLLWPGWVMGWYGEAFSHQGTLLLQIMAVGQLFNVAVGSVGQLLAMCQQERILSKNNSCVAGFNLVLNLLLIPWAGGLGAAIADSSSMIAKNLSALHLVKTKIQLRHFTVFGL